ncbi:MAG: carboxypeptidase-like regulatory domain-containing protein [Flavobacterium sp.]|nr:carboxypeptidase-like regulatory domain-containing protein [Flavobacterium sp.]
MKNSILLWFCFIGATALAQLQGTVRDEKGLPLPQVSIYYENTYIGTTTNEKGQFEIVKLPKTLVFQYLGYKTKREVITEESSSLLAIQLAEENITLNEVVINKKANPANSIIKSAIAARKDNAIKNQNFSADFYSRGLFKINKAPKKIMGQKFDAFDEILDSTRSGILYLSETVSKLTYSKPNRLDEVIVASKVSGNDNGFSFNNAASAEFDFYENTLPFEVAAISPLAQNAFNYYTYQLEGTFFDDQLQQVNKIKVTPKRESEPTFSGYMYIVDDSWAIYAVDLSISGKQIQLAALNTLSLNQRFSYNKTDRRWTKNTQKLTFEAGMMQIHITGGFTYVYSNYNFEQKPLAKTNKREVLRFEPNANKKDVTYWNASRPVPLTEEESTDYLKKELIQTKKKSKTYLDSVDRKTNKLGFFDIITGYTYKNSYLKKEIAFDGFLKGVEFNTVQGWNLSTGISFRKRNSEDRTYYSFGTSVNYGIDDQEFRGVLFYNQKLSNQTQAKWGFSGGSELAQFNSNNPISGLVNSVSTLFFKDNYAKYYARNFIELNYGQEVLNGIFLSGKVDFSERKPEFNHSDYVVYNKSTPYTSNNPLDPSNYTTAAIEQHQLGKIQIQAKFRFKQEYWSRPDGKFNLPNSTYPELGLQWEQGVAGSNKKYNYSVVSGSLDYGLALRNKGFLSIRAEAGQFAQAQTIAFVDYKHFNGNQTHFGNEEQYLNRFNLLPYYSSSTNDAFLQIHTEHDDQGYIMNKIPLLNKLQSTLLLGYHNLSVPDHLPYHEFSIGLNNLGIGKAKFFRIDYVRSYQNGYLDDGVIFGVKILNL